MMRNVLLGCCILLSCASCAAETRTASRIGQAVAETEANREPPDTGCSYFYFTWGKYAEAEGRLDEALEAYEKSLVCDPQSDYLMRSVAVLLVKMGRKHQATVWLDKIIEQHPEDKPTLTFLAELYANLDKTAEAAELYLRILSLDPVDGDTMLHLGILYARDQQYNKAREVLEKLVRLDDRSYAGYLYLARLYQELQYFDKSFQTYEKALELNWSDLLAFEVAEQAEQRKRFDLAVQLYRRILRADPADDRARAGLASIYLQRNETEQALQELQEMRSYTAEPQKVDLTIARILVGQKRYDEAIHLFNSLLQEDPNLEIARYLLALVYEEKGELPPAGKLLRSISPEAEVYEPSVMLLVKILEEDQKWQDARDFLLERLAGEETRRPSLYMLLATLYQEHGQAEKGREVYAEALQHYADEPEMLFQYGLFLERAGETEAAMSQMQRVLELEPDNPYALNFVGYTWADSGRNLQEALSYIEQAVALKPEDGFVRDSLGWVYFKLGDPERAAAELEKALELEPEDPNIYEHLGDVYLKLKDFQQAREAYERAVQFYEKKDAREKVKRKIEALAP